MTESPLTDRTVQLPAVGTDYAESEVQPTDEWTEDEGTPPDLSVYFHVTFGGGDPTATRVRDVSVTVPVRPADTTDDIAVIVHSVMMSLLGLSQPGAIESFSAQMRRGDS